MKAFRVSRVLRQVERLAAWLLVPLMFLQFLSGYAILHGRLFRGVLDKPSAFRLHTIIQPITVAAFSVHGLMVVRRALVRRGVRNPVSDAVLVLVAAGLVAFSIHLRVLG